MVFWRSPSQNKKELLLVFGDVVYYIIVRKVLLISFRDSSTKCPCRRRHSANGRLEIRKEHLNLMGLSCHFFSHQPSNADVLQVHIIRV